MHTPVIRGDVKFVRAPKNLAGRHVFNFFVCINTTQRFVFLTYRKQKDFIKFVTYNYNYYLL